MPRWEVTCRSLETDVSEIDCDSMQEAAMHALRNAPSDFAVGYVVGPGGFWEYTQHCACGRPMFRPMGSSAGDRGECEHCKR